nr:PqqD family peptide modification chaperone [uncultured Draconibacterium sp.]
MENLTTESIVQRKDDQLLVSQLGEDLVIMDMANGTYLSLNKTARIIWELVETPVKIEDIVRSLMSRFSIEEKTCTFETISFLSKIANQKALKIDGC